MMKVSKYVECKECGVRLFTDEAKAAELCFECRDPEFYERFEAAPDLETQFAMLMSTKS
jgi:hypothetical protein